MPALATVPLAALGARRRVVRGLLRILAVFFVPALLLGGEAFAESFAYHADRGVQVESVASSVLMQLGWVSGVVFEYGAFEVRARRRTRGRPEPARHGNPAPPQRPSLPTDAGASGRSHARCGAYSVHARLQGPLTAVRGLAPSLVPLSAAGTRRLAVSAVFLAACFLTTQVFPTHYDDLVSLRSPGPELLLAGTCSSSCCGACCYCCQTAHLRRDRREGNDIACRWRLLATGFAPGPDMSEAEVGRRRAPSPDSGSSPARRSRPPSATRGRHRRLAGHPH